ncbi:hypothetical protein [Phenylobacterium aquaticum]|uniref:hypothetical protein n=1 Tax=Phenylobacterium aquaticum TaxID=1763816 RepID=UPI0026F0A341|nr:hypothetical protein [Phenylobacterium aquaticum]
MPYALAKSIARSGLLSALLMLGACGGLRHDLYSHAISSDPEVNAAIARDALVRRLPIGSPIEQYIQLFRASAGSCAEDDDVSSGLYRCRCARGVGPLAQAEWIVEIRFDKTTRASTSVGVQFYVTSL